MLNVSFLKNSAICYECTGLTLFDSRYRTIQSFCWKKTACKAVLLFASVSTANAAQRLSLLWNFYI